MRMCLDRPLPRLSLLCTAMTAFDTAWPADSVEFCPHPDAHDVFVCGTYKLEQGENVGRDSDDPKPRIQVRRGKCMLFAVEEDGEEYRMRVLRFYLVS